MQFIPQLIPEIILIEPRVFKDPRGFFLETYHHEKYRAGGIDATFVQDNHSKSTRGTLRGLHAQLGEHAQGKLIRCVAGEIFDVAVDIRRDSPTFGKWCGEILSAENFNQLWIPPNFAHGFLALSEYVEVEYKCTRLYHPQSEISVLWNDPAIGVEWPLDSEPLLSEKDKNGKPLNDLLEQLPAY